ncbi:MAG: hypothetical protein ACR2PS_01650, partial [Pseudomonadales bacterium]
STLCRVEISHIDSVAEAALLIAIDELPQLTEQTDEIFSYKTSAELSGDNQSRTVFFLARAGHPLPETGGAVDDIINM